MIEQMARFSSIDGDFLGGPYATTDRTSSR